MDTKFYHGGRGGLKPNSFLVPQPGKSIRGKRFEGAPPNELPQHGWADRIYITTDLDLAIGYAAVYLQPVHELLLQHGRFENGEFVYPNFRPITGQVYEVTPIGELFEDPRHDEDTPRAFYCRSALIVAVCDIPRRDLKQARRQRGKLGLRRGAPILSFMETLKP